MWTLSYTAQNKQTKSTKNNKARNFLDLTVIFAANSFHGVIPISLIRIDRITPAPVNILGSMGSVLDNGHRIYGRHGHAKEKFDALEKDFDVMAKAAEEGKKHAHEANAWRVKYERTSELSIKIQQKRKADMENFDKVFNLASGYYKEVKHLTASRSAIRKEFNKLSKLVKTYVPIMFSVIKSAISLPMFKTELPNNIQQDAEKLCTGDVERAFELDYPDHCSDTDEDDDDGMSSELERLVGCVKLTKKPVESKLPWKPSLTVTVPRKGEKVSVQPVEEQSSNVVDIPATAAVPEPEPLPTVTEPGHSELMEPSIEQLGDEEADALLEVGAEAITMPVPVSWAVHWEQFSMERFEYVRATLEKALL
ncbi:unnamed protein product [Haemonchus placei]|uniref:BAR domain-containing protein n=1 Tax=Haemonchus placei TaxID=6290 RepID=A0A0N4XBK0_HAEPC|nr:unnamed protein product [Haemonchus placei]